MYIHIWKSSEMSGLFNYQKNSTKAVQIRNSLRFWVYFIRGLFEIQKNLLKNVQIQNGKQFERHVLL